MPRVIHYIHGGPRVSRNIAVFERQPVFQALRKFLTFFCVKTCPLSRGYNYTKGKNKSKKFSLHFRPTHVPVKCNAAVRLNLWYALAQSKNKRTNADWKKINVRNHSWKLYWNLMCRKSRMEFSFFNNMLVVLFFLFFFTQAGNALRHNEKEEFLHMTIESNSL